MMNITQDGGRVSGAGGQPDGVKAERAKWKKGNWQTRVSSPLRLSGIWPPAPDTRPPFLYNRACHHGGGYSELSKIKRRAVASDIVAGAFRHWRFGKRSVSLRGFSDR